MSVPGFTVKECRGASWGPIHACLTPLSIMWFIRVQVQVAVPWVSYSCLLCKEMALSSDSRTRLLKQHRSCWPLKLANFREQMNSHWSSSKFSKGFPHQSPGAVLWCPLTTENMKNNFGEILRSLYPPCNTYSPERQNRLFANDSQNNVYKTVGEYQRQAHVVKLSQFQTRC